ncbi:hypothetical protein [Ralstonia pseudosolanacearum]
MIIKGTLKQIGSSETSRTSEWGFIRSIEFFEDVQELRNISTSQYLIEKLTGCVGEKVELCMYRNALVGVKTSSKTYYEKPSAKVFANSGSQLGFVIFVFISVIVTFLTWGIGAIAPYMYYRHKLGKIKRLMNDELNVAA